MSWRLLLAVVFGAWGLLFAAAAANRAFEEARAGVPEAKRGGVSIVPAIPFIPLAFWGAAVLIDRFAAPWGTALIGGLHAVLAVVFAASIGRDWWRIRSLDKRGPR
jgi:hypothetical protein